MTTLRLVEGKYVAEDRSGNPLIVTLNHSYTSDDGYSLVVMKTNGKTFVPTRPETRKALLEQIESQHPR